MKKYKNLLIFTVIGSIAGYAYYYFWGCKNGCPIQSNPLTMILYGAAMGAVLGLPDSTRKKNTDGEK